MEEGQVVLQGIHLASSRTSGLVLRQGEVGPELSQSAFVLVVHVGLCASQIERLWKAFRANFIQLGQPFLQGCPSLWVLAAGLEGKLCRGHQGFRVFGVQIEGLLNPFDPVGKAGFSFGLGGALVELLGFGRARLLHLTLGMKPHGT